MKAIYVFDETARFKPIDAAFARYEMVMSEYERGGKGMIYVDELLQANFCKLFGYAAKNKLATGDIAASISAREVKHLLNVKKIISSPGYTKTYDAFNAKRVKMQSAVKAAEREITKTDTSTLNSACRTGNNILENINSLYDKASISKEVIAANIKLNKFIQKNQALYDSQFYSLNNTGAASINPLSGFVVNSQTFKSNGIDEAIDKLSKQSEQFIDDCLSEFKTFVRMVLQGASSFGFMIANDGGNDDKSASSRNVVIDRLTLEDLVFLKSREKLVFWAK